MRKCRAGIVQHSASQILKNQPRSLIIIEKDSSLSKELKEKHMPDFTDLSDTIPLLRFWDVCFEANIELKEKIIVRITISDNCVVFKA